MERKEYLFIACPLMKAVRAEDLAPCLKEHCAWWHAYDRPSVKGVPGRCALVSIADALTDMNLIGVDVNGN